MHTTAGKEILTMDFILFHSVSFFYSIRFLKWRVLERWRRLHAILEIEKEAEERRERWRVKANELINGC